MLFQQLNRSDAEKVYIICRNVSAATLSAGAAAFFEVDAVSDGNAISGAGTSKEFLFAGIVKDELADSSYGLVQVYGIASAYCVLAASNSAANAGVQLDAVTSQTYLAQYPGVSGSSTTIENPWNFVTLMETFASAASATSSASLKAVFVRAM